MIKYTIQFNDTLFSVAHRFGITPDSILSANPILNPMSIKPGTTINIPLAGYRYAYYDILGSTNKISLVQMKEIIKWRKYIVGLARNYPDELFINGQVNKKRISLTFDDGPDSRVTPTVLNILKSSNVKGNFFFVGKQISYFPMVVKAAYDQGHLILNHSWNHPYFTNVNSQGIRNEITLTENKIQSIIGKKPSIVRPPYGATDEKALETIKSTNNKALIWSIDSMDWVRNINGQNIIENVALNARPGDVVLMHSGVGQTAVLKVLPLIIKGLKEKGFEIVDLGELLNVNPYKL